MKVDRLAIPEGVRLEVSGIVRAMAAKNKVYSSIFRPGQAPINHYIPSIVKRHYRQRRIPDAAYTLSGGNQPEILQSIFEYQTMICELTDMDVSNASVYDGASRSRESPHGHYAITARKRQR